MTVTVNGVEIVSQDPKLIAKAIRKAKAEEAKAKTARDIAYANAKAIATEHAYQVLSHKARGERMEHLTYYPASNPGKYPPFRYQADGNLWLDTAKSGTAYQPYGYHFLGAVAEASGIVALVFLQDKRRPEVLECYAIAAYDDAIACVDVPGVSPGDFRPDDDTEND